MNYLACSSGNGFAAGISHGGISSIIGSLPQTGAKIISKANGM
jgi:hypothetical protein